MINYGRHEAYAIVLCDKARSHQSCCRLTLLAAEPPCETVCARLHRHRIRNWLWHPEKLETGVHHVVLLPAAAAAVTRQTRVTESEVF